MKIITNSKVAADRQAAEEIAALIKEKPDAVLALAAGESPKGVYAELRAMCGRGELSFAGVRIFALTEYADLPLEHPQNCRHMLEESLIKGIDIKPENCYFLTRDNYAEYDGEISVCGGLDLAVLGLGENVHIGFNEPSDSFSDGPFKVELTQSTINSNSKYFKGKKMPRYALTMGIGDIMRAKRILLIATGESKANAVFKMIKGEVTPSCPASVLQNHSNAVIYLDRESAKLL